MKIFYINLDERKDRRDYINHHLTHIPAPPEEQPWPITRFSAVKPTYESLLRGEYRIFYDRSHTWLKTFLHSREEGEVRRAIGTFGCYISHYKIHRIMENLPEPYIILEDDVNMKQTSMQEVHKFINSVEYGDWDMIRSLWDSKDGTVNKIKGVHQLSLYSRNRATHKISGGTHFTVFRDAHKILKFLDEELVFDVDSVYSTDLINVYHTRFKIGNLPLSYWGEDPRGNDIPKYGKGTEGAPPKPDRW